MAWYYWILVGYLFIGTVLALANYKSSRDWNLVHTLFSVLFWGPLLLMLGFCKVVDMIEGGIR